MSAFREQTLFGYDDKVSAAIERVRTFGKDGVIVAYSGGKDSVVALDIVKKSGVPYRAVYNLTTVDHPELVRFIKTQKDVEIQRPSMNMWQIIEKNGAVPTRRARFCCRILKEQTFPEGIVVTGVRGGNRGRGHSGRCSSHASKTITNGIFTRSSTGRSPKCGNT